MASMAPRSPVAMAEAVEQGALLNVRDGEEPKASQSPLLAAVQSFRGGNSEVALYVLVWFAFSTTLIFSNRHILVDLGFSYPLTLTGWHLSFATVATRALRAWTPQLDGVVEVDLKMTWRVWAQSVLPVGVLFSASLALGNYSYLYLSVAFIQMLKSLTPVAILLASWLLKTETPDMGLFINIAAIAFGVGVASFGEITFVLVGFLMMVVATCCESLKLVMVQKLLNGKNLKMAPLVSLYYFAPVCAFFNLALASILEWPHLAPDKVFALGVIPIFLNGLLSFGLNLASVSVIKKSSTLVLGLAGVVKDIAIVTLSMVVYATPMTTTQGVGYTIALVALFRYKTRKEAFWKPLTNVGGVELRRFGAWTAVAVAACLFMYAIAHISMSETTWMPMASAQQVHEPLVPPSQALLDTLKRAPDTTAPKLCVVARTFSSQLSYLPTFMQSLAASSIPMHIYFLVTEDSEESLTAVMEISQLVNDLLSYPLASVMPFTPKDSAKIFRFHPDHSDSGYAYTDLAIDYLIEHESSCDYVMFTNGDNMYVKDFASKQLLPHMKAKVDMMVMDYICYYKNGEKTDTPEISNDGSNTYRPSDFRVSVTDLGAALWRLEFLKTTGQRFLTPAVRKASFTGDWDARFYPYEGLPLEKVSVAQKETRTDFGFMVYAADGFFIERTAAFTDHKKKIRGALYFHQ